MICQLNKRRFYWDVIPVNNGKPQKIPKCLEDGHSQDHSRLLRPRLVDRPTFIDTVMVRAASEQ